MMSHLIFAFSLRKHYSLSSFKMTKWIITSRKLIFSLVCWEKLSSMLILLHMSFFLFLLIFGLKGGLGDRRLLCYPFSLFHLHEFETKTSSTLCILQGACALAQQAQRQTWASCLVLALSRWPCLQSWYISVCREALLYDLADYKLALYSHYCSSSHWIFSYTMKPSSQKFNFIFLATCMNKHSKTNRHL